MNRRWLRITDNPYLHGIRSSIRGPRQAEVVRAEEARWEVFPFRDGRQVVTGRDGPHYATKAEARRAADIYLDTGILDGQELNQLPLAKEAL